MYAKVIYNLQKTQTLLGGFKNLKVSPLPIQKKILKSQLEIQSTPKVRYGIFDHKYKKVL